MLSRESRVVVHISELLHAPLSIPASDHLVEVYHPSPEEYDVVGVYDSHSFRNRSTRHLLGSSDSLTGEVEIPLPIARQGNYVLWGFGHPRADDGDGQASFVNLLVNHKAQPDVPLSQARKNVPMPTGRLVDQLTKRYAGSMWNSVRDGPH